MSWIQNLSDVMNKEKISFTLYDKPISYEEVFAETGLLPSLIQRANQMCLLSLGYGLGASFVDNQDSILGVGVQFDEVTPDVFTFCYMYMM